MAKQLNFTNEQINDFLEQVHNGTIHPRNLPPELYVAISNRLMQGVFQGFGGQIGDDLGPLDEETLRKFRTNIFKFSAAKTFQQVNDMSNFVFDEFGFKTSFTDFRKLARNVFDLYNETWLEVEHTTAVNQSFGAKNWIESVEGRESAPLLKYLTVGDDRVRPTHMAWNGIVRPIDDKFWNTHFPPNGWNCRCIVTQHAEGDDEELFEEQVTPLNGRDQVKPDDPLFEMNPGKDQIIFKESHPYYEVAPRFEDFKDGNFGLQLPPE